MLSGTKNKQINSNLSVSLIVRILINCTHFLRVYANCIKIGIYTQNH